MRWLIVLGTCALAVSACGRESFDSSGDGPYRKVGGFHGPDVEPTPGDDDPGTPSDVCTTPQIPGPGERIADIISADTLARVAARMPCISDPELVALFESTDTLWYDKASMVPSYQDSAGDNTTFPVGMRPNTIQPNLIVEGGHEAFFEDIGHFHFPFGRPTGSPDGSIAAVDFWHVPRADGEILPVVWWFRQPNSFTWRYEWIFPVGTTLGEMLYVVDADGTWWPFEIRTRTREIDGWKADVFRPFPEATQLAEALSVKRQEDPVWSESSEIDALIDHLDDETTLVADQLRADLFPTVLPPIDGASDVLPGLSDSTILKELMMETGFTSTRGTVWKASGSLHSYAPTTDADFQVVPTSYNAGFLAPTDESCARCHRDAGHPFKDFHDFVYLYGELWGADQVFTWHPFEADNFVNADGTVKNFNYDNRVIRDDFASTGLVEEFDPAVHSEADYQQLLQPWSDFSY